MYKVFIKAMGLGILLLTSEPGLAQFGGGNCPTQNAGDSCQAFTDLEACIQADCNASCVDADGMPLGCTRVLTGGMTTCTTGTEPPGAPPMGTYPIGSYACQPPTPTPTPMPDPTSDPMPDPMPDPTSDPMPDPTLDPMFPDLGGEFPPVCTSGTCGSLSGCKSGNCYGAGDTKPKCSGGVCKPPPGGPGGPSGNNGDKKMQDIGKCLAMKTGEKIFWDICKKDPDCKALKVVIDSGKCFDSVCKDNPTWNYDSCVSVFCAAVGKSNPALAITCKSYGWAKIFRDCVLIPVIDETVTMACEIGHAIEHHNDPLPPTLCVTQGKNSPYPTASGKKGSCYKCCSKGFDQNACFQACDMAFQQGVFD